MSEDSEQLFDPSAIVARMRAGRSGVGMDSGSLRNKTWACVNMPTLTANLTANTTDVGGRVGTIRHPNFLYPIEINTDRTTVDAIPCDS